MSRIVLTLQADAYIYIDREPGKPMDYRARSLCATFSAGKPAGRPEFGVFYPLPQSVIDEQLKGKLANRRVSSSGYSKAAFTSQGAHFFINKPAGAYYVQMLAVPFRHRPVALPRFVYTIYLRAIATAFASHCAAVQ